MKTSCRRVSCDPYSVAGLPHWQKFALFSHATRLQYAYNTAAEWMMSGDKATTLEGGCQHPRRNFEFLWRQMCERLTGCEGF